MTMPIGGLVDWWIGGLVITSNTLIDMLMIAAKTSMSISHRQ